MSSSPPSAPSPSALEGVLLVAADVPGTLRRQHPVQVDLGVLVVVHPPTTARSAFALGQIEARGGPRCRSSATRAHVAPGVPSCRTLRTRSATSRQSSKSCRLTSRPRRLGRSDRHSCPASPRPAPSSRLRVRHLGSRRLAAATRPVHLDDRAVVGHQAVTSTRRRSSACTPPPTGRLRAGRKRLAGRAYIASESAVS